MARDIDRWRVPAGKKVQLTEGDAASTEGAPGDRYPDPPPIDPSVTKV